MSLTIELNGLLHWENIRRLGEALALNFNVVTQSREHCPLVVACIFRFHLEHKLSATLCASMLLKKNDARLGTLGCSPISKPRGERNTSREIGCDAAHIENNRAAPLHEGGDRFPSMPVPVVSTV
jgi:hypothetical protein